MRPWIKPYRRIGNIKVDPEVWHYLRDHHLRAEEGEDDDHPYPVLLDFSNGKWQALEPLHYFVWRRWGTRPRGDGEVIHHINGDKLDCRISNLGVGSRGAHAYVHRQRRQKFSPNRKYNLGGFHRPHAPGPVRSLSEEEAANWLWQHEDDLPLPSETTAKSGTTIKIYNEHDLDLRLAPLLPLLRQYIWKLDSGHAVPQPAPLEDWKTHSTRLLGLRHHDVLCTDGEAVLVGLLIVFGMDRRILAATMEVAVEIIHKMMKRPSVSEAVRMWQQFKRLPVPLWPTSADRKRRARASVGMAQLLARQVAGSQHVAAGAAASRP